MEQKREKFPERNLIGQKQGPRDATQGHGSDFQFYYCCITSECDVHVICHNYHHQQDSWKDSIVS